MVRYVKKASGEYEELNLAKVRRALNRAGADQELADSIAHEVEQDTTLTSTKKIYSYILARLHKKSHVLAARYNIKQALRDFGPTGFPFEKFVAELLKRQEYLISIDRIIHGFCVDHEVDIIAHKNSWNIFVECKFHHQSTIKTDVKVILYMKARFDDIKSAYTQNHQKEKKLYQGLIVTNTKFTSEAIKYAECAGVPLLGWSYPEKDNLQQLIESFHLHPITALTTLTMKQKRQMINNGLVLCSDIHRHIDLLKHMGFSDGKLDILIQEVEAVCQKSK